MKRTKLGGESKKVSDKEWKRSLVRIELTNISNDFENEIIHLKDDGPRMRLLGSVVRLRKMIEELM